MKPLRWCTNNEQHEYMRERQAQNRERSAKNANELWALEILKTTPYKWTPQAQWGYRIFDFWCAELGVAIELDGKEHDPNYDSYRDEYNYRRSGIVVLRVPNRDGERLNKSIASLSVIGDWKERKERMGITGHTKKDRRKLSSLPSDLRLLDAYLSELGL